MEVDDTVGYLDEHPALMMGLAKIFVVLTLKNGTDFAQLALGQLLQFP